MLKWYHLIALIALIALFMLFGSALFGPAKAGILLGLMALASLCLTGIVILSIVIQEEYKKVKVAYKALRKSDEASDV